MYECYPIRIYRCCTKNDYQIVLNNGHDNADSYKRKNAQWPDEYIARDCFQYTPRMHSWHIGDLESPLFGLSRSNVN